MNNRRRLLVGLGVGALLAPFASSAQQQGKVWRIGSIALNARSTSKLQEEATLGAMRELGWIEGQNFVMDAVFAENDASRLPNLAAALVARNPDLILAFANQEAVATAAKTKTIPIVFMAVTSPVEIGLVQSFAHPGGNMTGIANIGWELGGKRLQLLKELLPRMNRVGVLVEPAVQSSMKELALIEEAAKMLGVKVVPARVTDSEGLEQAFESLMKSRVDAVMVTHTLRFMSQRSTVIKLAQKHRVPVVGHRSELANEGALMSYSSLLTDQIRRGAQLVDKVLKGAKPADIPVEQPTTFNLVINQRTAKELGFSIPPQILLQASRVIE